VKRPLVLTLAAAALIAAAGASWLAVRWVTDVPGQSYRGPLPPATPDETTLAERLAGHVRFVAAQERNVSRNPSHIDEAARYIERTLAEMGYEVESQAYAVDGHTVRNLGIALAPAPGRDGAPTLVVGAHYDSYPGSPGANDNGTGTAALIELARSLADLRGRAPARLRLAFFTNEEPPYFQTTDMGSFRFASSLAERRERVAAMYSLETLGFFSDRAGSQRYPFPLGLAYPSQGDFVAFVSMTGSRRLMQESIKAFRAKTAFPSEGGAAPGFLPGIDWSDHWSFEQFDYPAIMITDTAYFRYPHYHTAQDTPDKVDFDKLARIVGGVERMIREKVASLR
jgi:hypothetical protein